MKRFALLVGILALVAAACGSSDEVAAVVNGTEITVADVETFAQTTFEEAAGPFNQALNTLVAWQITEDGANADFAYDASVDEVDEQLQSVLDNAQFESVEDMAESQGVATSTIRSYVVLLMTQEAIAAELEQTLDQPGDEEIDAQLTDNLPAWTTVCAAHILLETEEEAQAVAERLEAGEDFATLAMELSIDPGSGANGGNLDCMVAGGYVQPFAEATIEAPIGEVVGPVQSEFGYHLIIVSERTTATTDEVRAALLENALTTAFNDWYLATAQAAEVTVTEQYGQWVAEPEPRVLPPS